MPDLVGLLLGLLLGAPEQTPHTAYLASIKSRCEGCPDLDHVRLLSGNMDSGLSVCPTVCQIRQYHKTWAKLSKVLESVSSSK